MAGYDQSIVQLCNLNQRLDADPRPPSPPAAQAEASEEEEEDDDESSNSSSEQEEEGPPKSPAAKDRKICCNMWLVNIFVKLKLC